MDDEQIREAERASVVAMRAWSVEARTRWPFVRTAAECGVGWRPLLERLFDEVARESAGASGVAITTIAEKYGGLNIDVGTGDLDDVRTKTVRALAARAETDSENTCDLCGSKGRLWESGTWIMARCREHKPSDAVPVD